MDMSFLSLRKFSAMILSAWSILFICDFSSSSMHRIRKFGLFLMFDISCMLLPIVLIF